MAWTSPRTWVALTTAITAAALNTDLRDNLNYLKGLLDGTGSTDVTVPADLYVANDANFGLQKSTNPRLLFDSGPDEIAYDRTNNLYAIKVAGANALTIDSTGKLTGAGFYDSGAVSIAAGVSTDFSHGLGARPRFVRGWFSTVGSADLADGSTAQTPNILVGGSAADVRFSYSTNTVSRVTNGLGVTAWVRVFAMH